MSTGSVRKLEGVARRHVMPRFEGGLALAQAFYLRVLRPILDRRFPGLEHSAAKLHRGSDVLGFDTPRSMDHDWGPSNLDLFLREEDHAALAPVIDAVLREELPNDFRGVPTSFCESDGDGGVLRKVERGPLTHGVRVTTVKRFFTDYIGLDPLDGMSGVDWLLIPPQRLRTVASGRIFHDGLGRLEEARRRLAWYPRDVWLYLLACQWRKIDQEEPFMARCGDVGDELGSRLVASRMIGELMRLCFLMERRYCPYVKWFGTAFSELACAGDLTPIFREVLDATNWRGREDRLSAAYLRLAHLHNAMGLTEPVEPRIGNFHSRPYQVPHAGRFVDALRARIGSEDVKALPRDLGGVAQFADSTDLLDRVHMCRKLAVLYGE